MGSTDPFPLVVNRLDGVRRGADGWWTARCPAHKDSNPSLGVKLGDNGKVILRCMAGCDLAAVLAALRLDLADLAPPRNDDGEWTPHGPAVAVYDYTDETGHLLFQVLRTAGKQFPCRVRDETKPTGWRWSLGETRRVLYRLPRVLEAVEQARFVWVVEGEKDVHALEAAGEIATCSPGGAGKWRDEYAAVLAEHVVVVVADRDEPGYAHARTVRASLEKVGTEATIVEARKGKDAADHLAAGHSVNEFVVIAGPDEPRTDLAPDLYEFLGAEEDDSYDWLLDNLVERGERVMVTGHEGLGKTEMVAMLATATAAGVHPFTNARTTPRPVLFIDCESTERQLRRRLRRMEGIARKMGTPVPTGTMRIICRPDGLDLATVEHASWLAERVEAHKPALITIGPLYRLHRGNPNDEGPARQVAHAIDTARIRSGAALVLEAHSGHLVENGKRIVRPTGASLWLRWPEYGYGLRQGTDEEGKETAEHVDFVPWRGDREVRWWPRKLRRNESFGWPWATAGGVS